MSAKKSFFNKLSLAAIVFGMVVIPSVFTGSAFGQDFKRPDGSVPLPMDWSNQHLIYTVGFTREQASKMQSDPRYFVATRLHGKALADESAAIGNPTITRTTAASATAWPPTLVKKKSAKLALNKDWAVSLGGTGGVAQGMSPAKFVFDVNAPPSCTNDFAVFPVAAGTGNTRGSIVGTFSTTALSGTGTVEFTVTPTGGTAVNLSLTASTTVNTGTDFEVATSTGQTNANANATNLAAAINRNLNNGYPLGRIVAIASTNTVTVYMLTPGNRVALTVPTTVTSLTWGTPSTPTNGSQANIVGFNYLYSGSGTPLCMGKTNPEFIFSYASGVGPVATSPVISGSGTKIAYVENDTTLGAILHVLTFASGNTEYGTATACASNNNGGSTLPTCATNPVIPGSTLNSTATDFMLPLGLVTNVTTGIDSFSSPFVNFGDDTAFIGDDKGYLYSVTGVFWGTPAHAGGSFPVSVSANKLSSPVVDVSNTGNIFVGDSGGYFYNYSSGGTLEGTKLTISTSTAGGIRDGAIVDSTNLVGYVVGGCNSDGASRLTQFWFTTSTLTDKVDFDLTTNNCSSPYPPMYSPTPANNYYTKGISSGTDGNNGELLTCQTANSNPGYHVKQWQFASKALDTSGPEYNVSNDVGSTPPTCSPLNEFYGNPVGVTITAVSQSTTAVTIAASNSFVVNDVVGISGVASGSGSCTPTAAADIEGVHIIATRSSSSFTFTGGDGTAFGTGLCTLSSPTATLVGYAATAVSQSGTTVTVTTPTNALVNGQTVTIAGVSGGGTGCPTGGAAAINGEQVLTSQASTSIAFNSTLSATSGCTYTTTGATVTGPTQDYLFFGLTTPELYTWTLPMTGSTSGPTVTASPAPAGGTSAIIVDNDSSSGQAASLYFGTLATSTSQCGSTAAYCAVKLTQSGLL